MAERKAYQGVLHHYASRLVAFEFSSPSSQSTNVPDDELNTIVFVGGLFDDLLTVPFVPPIADNLPPQWRLMQARLSSSSYGWGIHSLDRDVKELSQCIAYVRGLRPKGKIVLMGHSTGSQATMHYAVAPLTKRESYRSEVDGYILQGPVSDREAWTMTESEADLAKGVALAKEYVDTNKANEILPKSVSGFMFPVSASRYLSLSSPGPEHDGQDDMFSSDLSDERLGQLFGKLGESKKPVQILYMGAEQYCPASIDKEALLSRWFKILKDHGGNLHSGSGLVPGHDHNGENSSHEVKMRLVDRVVAFAEHFGYDQRQRRHGSTPKL